MILEPSPASTQSIEDDINNLLSLINGFQQQNIQNIDNKQAPTIKNIKHKDDWSSKGDQISNNNH